MKVHPVTAIFPMMPDDELAELADDIKENGLRNPIMVQDGLLIDGRNRLKACEMAGEKPMFVQLAEDTDPVAYVLSVNLVRRHMTKGQRAMALAIMYPEPKRGQHSQLDNSTLGFDKSLLSWARTVLTHSRTLANAVLAGTERLSVAYEAAREAQGAGEKVTLAKVRQAVAEERDDGPPRPRRRPPEEIITSDISAQLVTLAHEALDEIVSLMGKMSQPDRVRFQQEAMERLGGDQ